MCLLFLTACFGLVPIQSPPQINIVVPAIPTPIIQPTTTSTTTTTTVRTLPPGAPGNMPTAAPVMTSNPPSSSGTNPPVNPTSPGMPNIDPRSATTPPSPSAFQRAAPPDSTVRFPREKRSVSSNSSKPVTSRHSRVKRQNTCSCVATGTCPTSTGAGMIDFRIVTPGVTPVNVQCPAGQVYCCRATTAQIACGTLQTTPATAVSPTFGQASFGEYPWQAMVLSKQNDYVAGGVLVDQLNVVTVTHRVLSYIVSGTAPNLKVRLGEWDAAATYEPIPYQEYTISKVFTHPNYNANTLQYGITVLRLSTPVPLTPSTGAAVTINRVCLPPTSTTSYIGMRCIVSGWGKNQFGVNGQFQNILKEVDVPIVNSATCQSQLQTARLGAGYFLDTTSFICAGGEANKDSCTGDGGSGLVCINSKGQFELAGLVSWGLGCAGANVPGVYVNIAGLLPWINQQIATA